MSEGGTASLQEGKGGGERNYSSQTGHERMCNLLSLWTLLFLFRVTMYIIRKLFLLNHEKIIC